MGQNLQFCLWSGLRGQPPPLLRPAWLSSHKSVYEQLWYFFNLYPILIQIVKTVSHEIILQEWDQRRIYCVSIWQCFCKTLHKYNKNETHFVSHTLLVTSLHCRWTSTTSHICLGRSSHLISTKSECAAAIFCNDGASDLPQIYLLIATIIGEKIAVGHSEFLDCFHLSTSSLFSTSQTSSSTSLCKIYKEIRNE